jgi:hypothetical protein
VLDLDVDAPLCNELSGEQRDDVERHVRDCIVCRRRIDRAREDYRAPLPALRAANDDAAETSAGSISGNVPHSPFDLHAPRTTTRGRPGTAPPSGGGPRARSAASVPPRTPTALGPSEASLTPRGPAARAEEPKPEPARPPAETAKQAPVDLEVAPMSRRKVSWEEFSKPANPPPSRKAPSSASGWRQHVPTIALVVGGVALLAVVIARGSGGEDETKPTGPQLPDGFELDVFRDRDGKPEQLLDSASARLGDRLTFVALVPETAPTLVVVANAMNEVTPLFPPKGDQAVALTAGEVPLPISFTLAGNPGIVRLIGQRCPAGISLADVSVLAAGVPESGKSPTIRQGCDQSIVRLRALPYRPPGGPRGRRDQATRGDRTDVRPLLDAAAGYGRGGIKQHEEIARMSGRCLMRRRPAGAAGSSNTRRSHGCPAAA